MKRSVLPIVAFVWAVLIACGGGTSDSPETRGPESPPQCEPAPQLKAEPDDTATKLYECQAQREDLIAERDTALEVYAPVEGQEELYECRADRARLEKQLRQIKEMEEELRRIREDQDIGDDVTFP